MARMVGGTVANVLFFSSSFFTYMAVTCQGVPLTVDFEMKKWDKQ